MSKNEETQLVEELSGILVQIRWEFNPSNHHFIYWSMILYLVPRSDAIYRERNTGMVSTIFPTASFDDTIVI